MRPDSKAAKIVSGIITGQIAGLVMAVVVMGVFWLVFGKSPLYPVQVIGATFFGEPALQGFHFGALLAGLAMHQLGPSLVWGIVFGLFACFVSIRTWQTALTFGLLLGVVTMVDVYVFVPMLMESMQRADIWNREVPMAWDWAAHLVFGATFLIFPSIERKVSRQQ